MEGGGVRNWWKKKRIMNELKNVINNIINLCKDEQEIYREYLEFCQLNSLNPLLAEDFDKFVRRVFHKVSSRSLGNPGDFYYFGLKRQEIPIMSKQTPSVFSATVFLLVEWGMSVVA